MTHEQRALVCVIDDDESVREALPALLRKLGFESSGFSSAEDFLASGWADRTECLVLDVAMPRMSGPELHAELKRRGLSRPVVFITAWPEEALRLRLIAQGAVACLRKPFTDTALNEAVHRALASR